MVKTLNRCYHHKGCHCPKGSKNGPAHRKDLQPGTKDYGNYCDLESLRTHQEKVICSIHSVLKGLNNEARNTSTQSKNRILKTMSEDHLRVGVAMTIVT